MEKSYKAGFKNVSFIGSLSEGCTVPRVFGINDKFSDKLNREFEFDLDYTLLEIPLHFQHCIEEDKEKRGFVKIKGGNFDFMCLARNIGWNVSDVHLTEHVRDMSNENGYIQPFKLKSIAKQKLQLKDAEKVVELIIAAALEEKKSDVSIRNQSNKVNKAAVEAEYLIKIKHRPIVQVSIDFATILKTTWWPELYNEWKNRKDRNWPSQNAIDELTKHCNIIAKPSDEEKENENTVEFRYSFGHIERSLVGMRSRQQMFIYLIFKIFLVKFLKPEDPDGNISSFLVKNTMLWVCEKFPPTSSMWNEDFESTCQTLCYLLSELLQSFESGFLPYYFDPVVNLIPSIPRETQEKVSLKIKEIISNLVDHMTLSVEKETIAGKEILKLVQSITDVFDEIQRKDYRRLLKQPELVIDVLKIYIDDINWSQLLKRIGDELARGGKKVEKEAHRFSDRVTDVLQEAGGRKVEKEVKRSGRKVEKEAKRIFKKHF